MTNKLKSIILAFIIVFALVACKHEKGKNEKNLSIESSEKTTVVGNYVSDGYSNRNQGYDWISVIVTSTTDSKLSIKVRSRADKKKPTCTFDAIVQKIDDNNYQTQINDKVILFQFSSNALSITTKNETDRGLLNFYCSGGASFAGTYRKINEGLDETQIDKTKFSKILNLQDIGFNISSIEENGENQLNIFTFGLQNEYDETFNIGKEIITNIETEDLNSDSLPELLIFTQTNDDNPKANIYAFSVNNKKSMSQVYFKPTEENKQINNGYNGNDEFSIVETSLVQRFPIFKNNTRTGRMRQIEYKLVDGETSRKFEIKNHSEHSIIK